MLGSLLVTVFAAVYGAPVCDFGKYGQNCDLPCSEDCGLFPETNLRPCHKDSGKCLEGCVHSRHGDHCDQLCSPNCISTICNQGNGGCTIGCTDGHSGYFCNITSGTQMQTTGTQTQTADGRIQTTSTLIQSGGGHYRHSMQWMLMLPFAIVSTICCSKNRRCRRTFEEGFTRLIRRNPICSWINSRQNLSRRETVPLVQLTTQDSDHHATSDPSHSERDPRLSTASHATPATPSQEDYDLFFASQDGDLVKVKRLLATEGVDVNCRVNESTPVIEAALYGHIHVVNLLVGKGADLSMVNKCKQNILHVASEIGNVDVVTYVLLLGQVDINSRGWRNRTPVMYAARNGRKQVVEVLQQGGADLSLVDDYSNNTLYLACYGGDMTTVEFLLSLDEAAIITRGWKSRTLVMEAAYRRHRNVVEFLLSNGADVSLVDDDKNNILHWACDGGDVETVTIVLKKYDCKDTKNLWGQTPADVARLKGHQEVVQLLDNV